MAGFEEQEKMMRSAEVATNYRSCVAALDQTLLSDDISSAAHVISGLGGAVLDVIAPGSYWPKACGMEGLRLARRGDG